MSGPGLVGPTGRPVEVVRVPAYAPRTNACPICNATSTTTGRFAVAAHIADDKVMPVCRGCLSRDMPALGKALEGVNLLAEALGPAGWTYARQCINALHLITREVAAAAPQDEVRASVEHHPDTVREAAQALIARAAFGAASEITVFDAIGEADPYFVAEFLARALAALGDDFEG